MCSLFFKAKFLFEIGTLGFIWHLDFVICHREDRVNPPATARKNKWQTDETNRTHFNNLISRLTYGKELLNFGKTSHFYKTNHLQLRRVGPPALTARKNKWQTDETNHAYFGVKRAGGNRPTYEKDLSNSRKQVILTKRITPPSPRQSAGLPQIRHYLP